MLPSLGLEGLKLEQPHREVWQRVSDDHRGLVPLPTQGRTMVLNGQPSQLIFPGRDSMTPSNLRPMLRGQT